MHTQETLKNFTQVGTCHKYKHDASIAKCNINTYRPNLDLNHSDTVITYSPN